MAILNQKKFRIEIDRERTSGQLNGSSGSGATNANMAAHRETLRAIHALKQDLHAVGDAGGGLGPNAERIIQEKLEIERELKLLSEALEETKREIAGLRYSAGGSNRIVSMGHQLDAITDEAEHATNKILSAAEIIDEDLQRLIQNAEGDDEFATYEKLSGEVIKIFEACNFQDLTGQRVTKVVETLKHVEERIGAMIKSLGADESVFAELAALNEEEESELEGPQHVGETNSQADIDALFD